MGRFDDAAGRVAAQENQAQQDAAVIAQEEADLAALVREFVEEAHRRQIPTRWFSRKTGTVRPLFSERYSATYEQVGFGWLVHTDSSHDDRSTSHTHYVVLSDGLLYKTGGNDASALSTEPVLGGHTFERVLRSWSPTFIGRLEESAAKLLAWKG